MGTGLIKRWILIIGDAYLKMVKKLLFLFAFLVVINLFVGSKGWPPPQNLPSTPNCAADGPNCKQFNPDLK